jgi:adenylyl-sulfate kinase
MAIRPIFPETGIINPEGRTILLSITRTERSQLNGHKPAVLWFTGLSGSGKSTIAAQVEDRLFRQHRVHTYLLDGDILRTGLNKDLDFTDAGRKENIRRTAEVMHLFFDAGLLVLTTFISPFRSERAFARSLVPAGDFIEVYMSSPLAVCESRDPKQLYRKARSGLIPNFTGIDSPYEPPEAPEIILDSATWTIPQCTDVVLDYLMKKGIIN